MSDKTHMYGGGESYSGVIPAKQPNKGGKPPAEVVEGRPLTKENAEQSAPVLDTEPGGAGQSGWIACAKQQRKTASYSSRLCCTT